MSPPGATYRLQFRGGMTFRRAAALAPYLASLGITHLYASPIFTAAPGSTHGYDVVNHNEFDPVLGGETGFQRMVAALKAHGLGFLLDIVPNHMAASTANPWFADVLMHGSRSRYARHFDIDWSAPKLLLPRLGEPYGEALEAGHFALRFDAGADWLAFGYFDEAFPLSLASCANLLGRESALADVATALAGDDSKGLQAARTALAAAVRRPQGREALQRIITGINADRAALHALHEAQVWRLAYWRLAREALTYRRFFEIADLIGVRVEDARVFDDVHALALKLVREGLVDGLRIDHIDGLADPKGYLDRLAAAGVPYVVVEKILGAGEALRADWQCAGTTGYEVAAAITGVGIETAARDASSRLWTAFTGEDDDVGGRLARVKRLILTQNLAGELKALVRLAGEIAASDIATRDLGRNALRLAIIRIAAALPVYRTYIDGEGAAEEDRRLIAGAVAAALADHEIEDRRAVDFIAGLLLGAQTDERRAAFIGRFQQTTGPLAAKSVEDTHYYRFSRLIALNEVGSDPAAFGLAPEVFHAFMAGRAERTPDALSATATHDTKRGEDARARLALLGEAPAHWAAAVERWHAAADDLRTALADGPAPDRALEWLLYQALLGAWPADLLPEVNRMPAAFTERMQAFLVKAVREAKLRTRWTAPNEEFEAAVTGYLRGVLARPDLVSDIAAVFAPFVRAGLVNSLAQVAIKLTAPGVPDIYQGSETFDFSLVDPDNRRPVDFASRESLLGETARLPAAGTLPRWREGLPKLWLIARLLALRRRHPDVFARGRYMPLAAAGPAARHVLAFAREHGGMAVITIAPRLPLLLLMPGDIPRLSAGALTGTHVRLPFGLAPGRLHTLEGAPVAGGETLAVGALITPFPVAVLVADT